MPIKRQGQLKINGSFSGESCYRGQFRNDLKKIAENQSFKPRSKYNPTFGLKVSCKYSFYFSVLSGFFQESPRVGLCDHRKGSMGVTIIRVTARHQIYDSCNNIIQQNSILKTYLGYYSPIKILQRKTSQHQLDFVYIFQKEQMISWKSKKYNTKHHFSISLRMKSKIFSFRC